MDADKVSKNIKFKQLSQEKKEDYLLKTYQEVLDLINQAYIQGTLAYMEKAEKYSYKTYQNTEDTLNSVWTACLEGDEVLSSFLDLAEEYCAQIMAGIKRYKGHLANVT